MRPPAEDSATATLCLRAFRIAPTADAIELRSFMTGSSSISLGVRARARRIAESRVSGLTSPTVGRGGAPMENLKEPNMPMNNGQGIKQVGYFDCAGGGQEEG